MRGSAVGARAGGDFPMHSGLRASPRFLGAHTLASAAVVCGVALGLGHAPPASAAPITVDIQVIDEPGGGFNDPVLGPARLNAMRFAAGVWGSFFDASFA